MLRFGRERSVIAGRLHRVSTNEAPFTPDDPEWRAVRTLADGTKVVLRPLAPADKDGLREAFAHLSFETRYLRFFSAVTEPSESVLRYLTSVDQVDHVAIVATIESLDMKTERGAGIARFVRVAGEPHVAEAAVTVVDDMQRRGLGTVLLVELTRAALARGVRIFRGEVLATNEGMLQILERVGAKLDTGSSDDVALDEGDPRRLARAAVPRARTFEVVLEPEEPRLDHAIVQAFRAAARSMATELRSMFGADEAGRDEHAADDAPPDDERT